MTTRETEMLMAIFKAVYPEYYKGASATDIESAIALWAELLEPYQADVVTFAAKRLISESPYPPKISDVVGRAKELMGIGQDEVVEAWAALAKAASKASVLTKDEYAALPFEVRRFCGSLSGLIDLGRVDSDIFNTVTRGQFMKTYEIMRRQRETLEIMPPELKAFARMLTKALPSQAAPTDDEWNGQRNQLLDKLEKMEDMT